MANRLPKRDYRLATNSPTGTIADSDLFSYDDAGRTLTATSGRYNNVVSLAYTDGAGRLTSEALTLTGSGVLTGSYTASSHYDLAGNRDQITYPDNSVVTRGYDRRNQLATIGYNVSGGAVASVATYSHDDGMRLTGCTFGNGLTTAWTLAGRTIWLLTSIRPA